MDAYENNFKIIIKKYLPIIPLILLTVFLIIIFRHKKEGFNKLIEKGKQDLFSFYTQNLEPIFTPKEISNEDVFNFALYKALPIDQQNNKVLFLSNTKDNNQTYEIKPTPFNYNTKNYERFINYFGLTKEQKEKTDSILNSYKKDLALSLLVNDKNTIAINPKLADIQKAIFADLLNYFLKVNHKKVEKIFLKNSETIQDKNFLEFISSTKRIPNNEYIFVTPDTVFKKPFVLDTNKLNLELNGTLKLKPIAVSKLQNINVELVLNPNKNKETKFYNYIAKHDSDFMKVTIPINEFGLTTKFNDSLKIKIENLENLLKNIGVSSEKIKHTNSQKTLKNIELKDKIEFQFEDPMKFANKAVEMLSQQKDWEEFGYKVDSLAKEFRKNYSDSILIKINKSKSRK